MRRVPGRPGKTAQDDRCFIQYVFAGWPCAAAGACAAVCRVRSVGSPWPVRAAAGCRACHARRDALPQAICEKVYLFLVHLRPISGPLRTQVDRNPPRAAPPSDRGHGRPCLDWTGRHPPRACPARSPHAVQYSCGLYGGARGLRRWFSSAQRTAPACRRRPGRPRASAGTGARAARALHRLGASAGRMSS